MSKRGGEESEDSDSAKKQKMEDDSQTDAVIIPLEATKHRSFKVTVGGLSSRIVSPFAEATKLRSFKLVVEDKSIFVNPYFLGDFSPFFDTLCLGQFAEAQKGEAELKDAKYDDVIEMLKVLGADTRNLSREIDISNCVPMLYMADKWNIEVLRKKCIFFIENEFPIIPTNLAITMKFLIGCEQCGLPDSALYKVAARLPAFGRYCLLAQRVHRAITNKALYCAILSATNPYEWLSELEHDEDYKSIKQNCYAADCERKGRKCHLCGNYVCDSHLYPCPTRLCEYKTAKNVELDSAFFKTWPNDKLCWEDETSA